MIAGFFSLHSHHSVCLFPTHAFRVCLHQFMAQGFYGHGEPNNTGHGNDADYTGRDTRETSGGAHRFNGCVSRVRHAVNDGGGVAVFPCGCGIPDEPFLENPGFQPKSCGVVRVLSARHDSAGVLFPSWCGVALFLRSMDHPMTYFTFEDTLSQIGLGYPLLFLLGFRSSELGWAKRVWAALCLVLLGYWLVWALYPAAPANFNWQSVGVSATWNTQHNFTGFAGHWNKNYNFGNHFDQWFLNLFPRENRFEYNSGGYLTLSFIPTLGTMILGLIAGQWLRESRPKIPIKKLIIVGVSGIVLGLALHYSHISPVVKRIWTPSWTIFSGGICFLFLAAFSWVIDVKRFRKWAFPLVVIGMNSIAAYCIAHFMEGFLDSTFRVHLGPNFFRLAGAGLEPFFGGAAILLCYWLVLFWMYRRKLFLKI